MAKVPEKFEDTYSVNGHKIQVIAEVSMNDFGCYVAKIMHRKYDPETDGYSPWRKAEFPLNGPGKSKLERKIGRYLKSTYRVRTH